MKVKTIKKKRRKAKLINRLLLLFFAVVALGVALFTGLYVYLSCTVNTSQDLRLFSMVRTSGITRFYYDQTDGDDVYVPVEWQGEQLQGSEKREWTSIDQMPDKLIQAFLSVEDRRFYKHDGVDWFRFSKAVANYFLKFSPTFGASTVTQQLIKNLSGENERTPMRKIKEAYRAVALEKQVSKKDILEAYLNVVPLGRNISGVGMASRMYFGKHVSELTITECAALAAITNSPARYDMYRHPEANRERRSIVLQAMENEGALSSKEREAAEKQELQLVPMKEEKNTVCSWYTDQVVEDVITDLCHKYGMSRGEASRLVYEGGLHIHTCVDPQVQSAMEKYFCREGVFSDQVHYAMTVLSAKTGDLVGIVGREGVKEGNRLLNYAAGTRRPPGSAIKPLSLYAPALEEGLINYATVLDDVPVSFDAKEGGGYRPWPRNYPSCYQGLCDMRDAVAYSKNTIAVRVFHMLGSERCYDWLTHRLHVRGIVRHSTDKQGKTVSDLTSAPLALGQLSYGVMLLDMTAAYGVFTDGFYKKPRSYVAVYDGDGGMLLEQTSQCEKALSPQNAYIMTKLLQGVTEFGTASSLTLPRTVCTAGKTGTSSYDRDRWFIGYTPEYVAGIWCGVSHDGASIGDVAPGHLEAWDDVMKSVYHTAQAGNAQREFTAPPGVYTRLYCRDSGGLPCECCLLDPRGRRLMVGYFTEQQYPREKCTCHVPMLYDDAGGGVVIDGYTKGLPRLISLLKVENRSFPMQIPVKDAQYVYRDIGDVKPSGGPWKAFFSDTLSKGTYVGISPDSERQFNALSEFYGKQHELSQNGTTKKKNQKQRKRRKAAFFLE